jgi:hypothetical protein
VRRLPEGEGVLTRCFYASTYFVLIIHELEWVAEKVVNVNHLVLVGGVDVGDIYVRPTAWTTIPTIVTALSAIAPRAA